MCAFSCTLPVMRRTFGISKNLSGQWRDYPDRLADAETTTTMAASSALRRNIPVSWIKQRGVEVTQNSCGKETKVTSLVRKD